MGNELSVIRENRGTYMGEEPTKEELLLCLLNWIECNEHEVVWWADSNVSVKETIKDHAMEGWIYQDMYDFAKESASEFACEILSDYYWRVHRFYTESTSDEAKQIFASAMNESSNTYEYLLNLYSY